MTALPKNLEQAIRILKWLDNNLQMGETSLKYLEETMNNQYKQPNWDQFGIKYFTDNNVLYGQQYANLV